MHKFLKFTFGIELYMFRTGFLSIIRSLVQYDIHLLLCIQYQTPDDGQKSCLKHVEFYSKNIFVKLVHLVGFVKKKSASSDESVKPGPLADLCSWTIDKTSSFLQLNPKTPNSAHKPPPVPLTSHLSPFLLEILLNIFFKFATQLSTFFLPIQFPYQNFVSCRCSFCECYPNLPAHLS